MFLGWSIPSSSALVSLLRLLLPSPVPIPLSSFSSSLRVADGRTGRWSCRRRRHRVAWSCYDSYFVKAAAAPRATASVRPPVPLPPCSVLLAPIVLCQVGLWSAVQRRGGREKECESARWDGGGRFFSHFAPAGQTSDGALARKIALR